MTFTLDTTAPTFSDLLPTDGNVDKVSPVTVSGRVSADATLVTVGGQPAALSGGAFSLPGVALVEGPNTIALSATDRAGNAGPATLHLVLDTTPPTLAITSPTQNALLGALSADVSGTVSDPNLDSVTVEGGASDRHLRDLHPLRGRPPRGDQHPHRLGSRQGWQHDPRQRDRHREHQPRPRRHLTRCRDRLGASPVTVSGTVSDPHLGLSP